MIAMAVRLVFIAVSLDKAKCLRLCWKPPEADNDFNSHVRRV